MASEEILKQHLMGLSKEDLSNLVLQYHYECDRLLDEIQAIHKKPTLIVESGSVDIDRLEEDGFYVIAYRQGATPPQILK